MKRWDDLRLFLAVARSGTLTAAAKSMDIGVSTLHRHLAGFEAELGSALFEKGPRGYQLTHVGEALLPQAEEVEEAVLAATRTVVGHDQQVSGEVRITLPLVLLSEISPYLAAFSRQHYRIRLVLQADDAPLDLKRDTDLALRATTQPQDTAIGRKLCGVAWARYACAESDGADLPWLHYKGMNLSPAVQWRRKTYPSGNPMMQVQGVMGMLSVLAASGAQGLLPCFVGDSTPSLRRLGGTVATNDLWLLIHADLRRSARVRALADFLVMRIQADRARFEGVPQNNDSQ